MNNFEKLNEILIAYTPIPTPGPLFFNGIPDNAIIPIIIILGVIIVFCIGLVIWQVITVMKNEK